MEHEDILFYNIYLLHTCNSAAGQPDNRKDLPLFRSFLIIMAVMVSGVMLYKGFTGGSSARTYMDTIKNMHSNPTDNILFPMLFIVISCGAISGFHATQSRLFRVAW